MKKEHRPILIPAAAVTALFITAVVLTTLLAAAWMLIGLAAGLAWPR